jgi:hypothetical protein
MALTDHKLPLAQQENLLALLAHSDEHGKLIARTCDPSLFEGDYRQIAERCVEYWRTQGEAPKVHTADLFSDILEDDKNRRAAVFRRVLISMLQLNDEGINAKYVLGRLSKFTRLQHLKQAIHHAAEIVNNPGETSIEQTEAVLQEIIAARDFDFNPGMRMTEVDRMLDFLQQQQAEFEIGISVLDKAHIIPMRGKVLVLAAPSGLGKTWGLVNIGKRNLVRKKKIIHYTGELDEEDVTQRYYQALFAVTTRPEEDMQVPAFKKDREGNLVDIVFDDVHSDFTFESESIRDELMTRITVKGDRFFSNLIVKRFPDDQWTVNDVAGDLDSLEATEGFIPDMVLFDSPYHLKTDVRNGSPRFSLIGNLTGLRNLARERNFALVATHQISDEGSRSGNSRGTHLAEAKGIKWVCDNLLTYSSTDMEHNLGLARLYVDKARKETDKFGALITQNYKIGQFCLSSMRLNPRYFDIRKSLENDESGENEEDRSRGGFADDYDED